ncbi:MAG: flagellar biosynthetic protein FliR [Pseudomonadales bacterium]
MIEFALSDIEALVASYVLPLFRIAAFFMVVPILGTRMVPSNVRMILALLITSIIVPLLPALQFDPGFNLQTAVAVVQEVLVGVLFGFSLQIFFHVFVITGQMIAMQMGLGFASMVDPSNGVSVAVVSQFFVILTTLMFLAMNGHLVMIEIMLDSFKRLPTGGELLVGANAMSMLHQGTWMFAHALLLALPAVSALLIVNLAFGVMTKAAPQLNVFSLGFPTAIVLGGFFLWYTLAGFSHFFQQLLEAAFAAMSLIG